MKEVFSLILALVAVIGILYLSYIVSKYIATKTPGVSNSKYIKIIDKVMVGQDKFIMVAEIQSQFYLLGATQNNIDLISKLDNFDKENYIENSVLANNTIPFGNMLTDIITKAKKKGEHNDDKEDN